MSVVRAWPRLLWLCLFGAALATGLDREHVTHRVLAYAHPSMGVQAWWAPLLFAASTLALLAQARALRREGDAISPRGAALRVADLAAAYLVTSLARDFGWWLALGLAATWLPWVWRAPRQWALGLTIAVAGPLVECALTRLGAFHYLPDQPLIAGLGVPVWLPALYLHVSLAARALDLAALPAQARGALDLGATGGYRRETDARL